MMMIVTILIIIYYYYYYCTGSTEHDIKKFNRYLLGIQQPEAKANQRIKKHSTCNGQSRIIYHQVKKHASTTAENKSQLESQESFDMQQPIMHIISLGKKCMRVLFLNNRQRGFPRTFIVRSADPVQNHSLLGSNAMDLTHPKCPLMTCTI